MRKNENIMSWMEMDKKYRLADGSIGGWSWKGVNKGQKRSEKVRKGQKEKRRRLENG